MFYANEVRLIGNVGSDPETGSFQSGGKWMRFRLATERSWKPKDSTEWQSKTEWHNIEVLADRVVERIAPLIKKGSRVQVEGALEYQQWQDKNTGQEREAAKVVVRIAGGAIELLHRPPKRDERPAPEEDGASRPRSSGSAPPPPKSGDLDDEMPF